MTYLHGCQTLTLTFFFCLHFQQQGSASAEMEIERLKHDYERSIQTVQQWKKMYDNLHQFCVNELLDGDQVGIPNGNAA